MDIGAVILAPHGGDRSPRVIRLFEGFDTLVYEKCTGLCGHTQVEVGDAEESAVVHCTDPFRILALVGTLPEGLKDEEISDDEENSSDGGSDDGDDGDDGDDEAGVSGTGPFPSVPCLFCRKAALNPKLRGEKTSKSVIRYGNHSYGYSCARCQKTSWITGAQPVGFGEAATGPGDASVGLLPVALSSAVGIAALAAQRSWTGFFGFS